MALETLSYYVNSAGKYICVKNCTPAVVYVPTAGLELEIAASTNLDAVLWNLLRVQNILAAQNIANTAAGKTAFDNAINPAALVADRLGLNDASDIGKGNLATKTALDVALSEQFTSYSQLCLDCVGAGFNVTNFIIASDTSNTNINVSPLEPSKPDTLFEAVVGIAFQLENYQPFSQNFASPIPVTGLGGVAQITGIDRSIFGFETLDLDWAVFNEDIFFGGGISLGNAQADALGLGVFSPVQILFRTRRCGDINASYQQ